MMRRRRKTIPLIALLGFEVAAIIGLQAMGQNSSMRVPWSDLSTWLNTSTVEELAPPIIHAVASVIALWMFATTALSVLAQLSRIPAAIQAASLFTLPSVRRIVDGAVVMSIATTAFVGFNSAALADDTSTEVAQQVNYGDQVSVSTPTLDDDFDVQASVDSPTTTAPEVTTTLPPTTTTAPPTTTSTSTTRVPDNTNSGDVAQGDSTTTAPPVTVEIPSVIKGAASVVTPRLEDGSSAPVTTSTTSTTIAPTSTTVPPPVQETSAPAPVEAQTQVLGVQEHKVESGENLWVISRDALAAATNRQSSDLSEKEIRDYWLNVINENHGKLLSGDPNWIYPGEIIQLPSI